MHVLLFVLVRTMHAKRMCLQKRVVRVRGQLGNEQVAGMW